MPSISSLLTYAAISILISLQLSTATPLPHGPPKRHGSHRHPRLPTTGSGTQLPDPSRRLDLQYVTLGRGVQNYTCASSSASDTPDAIGAVASLFDITRLADESSSSSIFTTLPNAAVYMDLPGVQKFLDHCMPRGSKASIIGKHYFNGGGVPEFDITSSHKTLFSKKVAGIPPPSGSDVGPAGTGAVAWLKLDDAGKSVGLKEVYRVYTAGGNPGSTCAGKTPGGVFAVEYSAMYWFYG